MYSIDKHVIDKLCVISFVFFRRFALHGPEPPFLVCMGEVGSGENIKKRSIRIVRVKVNLSGKQGRLPRGMMCQ